MISPSEEIQGKIDQINEFFNRMITPKDYGKVEVKVDTDFETTCHYLSEHTNKDVKHMTVKEYYTLLDVVNKKNKRKTGR